MHRDGEMNTAGDRWESAPVTRQPMHTGSIQGVWVPRGKKVRWIYTHDLNGSHVSGYEIVDLLPGLEAKEQDEESLD